MFNIGVRFWVVVGAVGFGCVGDTTVTLTFTYYISSYSSFLRRRGGANTATRLRCTAIDNVSNLVKSTCSFLHL